MVAKSIVNCLLLALSSPRRVSDMVEDIFMLHFEEVMGIHVSSERSRPPNPVYGMSTKIRNV